jgi:NADH-quinone oxidoreductase subunit C
MSKTTPGALPYPVGRQRPHDHLAKELAPLASSLDGKVGQNTTDVDFVVAPEKLHTLISALKERSTLSFDMLRNISGVDFEAEGMALKYQLYSFKHGHSLQVTVPTGAGHPHVPTITGLYPAADWHEREAAEMFGFVFDGHPNPKNLLLEEDLHIHPLLKAHPLQKAEIKQGIEAGPAGFTF